MNDYDDTPQPSPYRLLPLALGIVLVLACGVGGVVFLVNQRDAAPPSGAHTAPARGASEYPYPECERILASLRASTGYPDEIEVLRWRGRHVDRDVVTVSLTFRGRNSVGAKSVESRMYTFKGGELKGSVPVQYGD